MDRRPIRPHGSADLLGVAEASAIEGFGRPGGPIGVLARALAAEVPRLLHGLERAGRPGLTRPRS